MKCCTILWMWKLRQERMNDWSKHTQFVNGSSGIQTWMSLSSNEIFIIRWTTAWPVHLNLGPDQPSPEVLPRDVWVSVVHSLPANKSGRIFCYSRERRPKNYHSFCPPFIPNQDYRKKQTEALMCVLYLKIKKTYSLLLLHLIRFLSSTDQLFFWSLVSYEREGKKEGC